MCSVQNDGDLVPEKKIPPSANRKCMKCSINTAIVIIRSDDPLCRECFMAYCVHKFRMTFGKSRVITDLEKLLIAYSGGAASAALTNLVLEGKSERAKRQLRFIPTLIYIEEGDVSGLSTEEQSATTRRVIANMNKTGFNCAVYSLNQVFHAGELRPVHTNVVELSDRLMTLTAEDSAEPVDKGNAEKSELQRLLKDTKTLTAKQELVSHLRRKLLSKIAIGHGVQKVLLGDCATKLAIGMLSTIAQGGGAHLSQQMGFIDDRGDGVMFLRPVKGFTSKEVALYNALNNVPTVFSPNLSTKTGTNSSLQRLTEEFINGLQQNFPNTVYTVCRTGEKLDLVESSSDGSGADRCSLCQEALDTNVGDSSALSATLFSQHLCDKQITSCNPVTSTSGGTAPSANQQPCSSDGMACPGGTANQSSCNTSGQQECCGEGDGSCQSTKKRLSRADLSASLCYSCRLVIKDMMEYESLPPYVLEGAGRRTRRKEMKEEIAEFLLEETT